MGTELLSSRPREASAVLHGPLSDAAGKALLRGFVVWVLYTALEPIVRRRLPRSLIGWNRLLGYRLRDAVVGREILFGSATGLFCAIVWQLKDLAPRWQGLHASLPSGDLDCLNVGLSADSFCRWERRSETGSKCLPRSL